MRSVCCFGEGTVVRFRERCFGFGEGTVVRFREKCVVLVREGVCFRREK